MVSLDNENQLLLQEDALISCRRVSIDSHPQILSWLTVHLQPLMAHSIALKMAFPQQMYQVASTALSDPSGASVQNERSAHKSTRLSRHW